MHGIFAEVRQSEREWESSGSHQGVIRESFVGWWYLHGIEVRQSEREWCSKKGSRLSGCSPKKREPAEALRERAE